MIAECLAQDPESDILVEAGPPIRPRPTTTTTEAPVPKRRGPAFRRKQVVRDPEEDEGKSGSDPTKLFLTFF